MMMMSNPDDDEGRGSLIIITRRECLAETH
jgi:hypothetical protein